MNLKLRIIEIIPTSTATAGKKHSSFIIEQKHLTRWKQVVLKDIHNYTKSYNTYEEAETYIMEKYMKGWGEIIKNGNVYEYNPYSYFG